MKVPKFVADRKKVKKELTKVFSLYIRARDKKCMMAGDLCKCGGPLQCNHLVTRANLRLAWDEQNAVGGCAGHNTWAHFHEAEWRDYWRERWPERAKYLDLARQSTMEMTTVNMLLLIADYRKKLKELEEK